MAEEALLSAVVRIVLENGDLPCDDAARVSVDVECSPLSLRCADKIGGVVSVAATGAGDHCAFGEGVIDVVLTTVDDDDDVGCGNDGKCTCSL